MTARRDSTNTGPRVSETRSDDPNSVAGGGGDTRGRAIPAAEKKAVAKKTVGTQPSTSGQKSAATKKSSAKQSSAKQSATKRTAAKSGEIKKETPDQAAEKTGRAAAGSGDGDGAARSDKRSTGSRSKATSDSKTTVSKKTAGTKSAGTKSAGKKTSGKRTDGKPEADKTRTGKAEATSDSTIGTRRGVGTRSKQRTEEDTDTVTSSTNSVATDPTDESATTESEPATIGATIGQVVAAARPEEFPVRAGEDPWTGEELAGVQGELEAEIGRLAEQIQVSETELVGLLQDSSEGAGRDPADVGSTNFERDHEISLANNARELLDQTRLALRHISAGTYGVCDSCGGPIGKGRLQAFPRATLCMKCKQREERR